MLSNINMDKLFFLIVGGIGGICIWKLSNKHSKTYIDEEGYSRFTDSDIPVDRWVAEKKLGRKLRPEEVVHHIDRDKLNNSAENLWVFRNQEEHDRAHREDERIYGKSAWYPGFNRS